MLVLYIANKTYTDMNTLMKNYREFIKSASGKDSWKAIILTLFVPGRKSRWKIFFVTIPAYVV